MQVISKIEEINPYLWENLIQSSETASFFQTKACYDFYASLSFLKPFVFAVRDERKLLALVVGYVIADGNIIKKFFSRRAIVPGGMLIHPEAKQDDVKLLLNALNRKLSKKAIYIELRNYCDFSKFKVSFVNCGFFYLPHLNFHVDTTSIEIAYSKLSSTKQRDVRQSFKNGAEVNIATSLSEIKEFFEILKELYLKKVKTPLFPVEFFENLFLSGSGVFILVKYQNEIIGGSVCAKFPNKTLYEWFVCGLDGKFKGVFPSTLATWASIEFAANYGYSKFDMMGAGKPEDGYGVRNFKSKFGGELVEYGRFIHICNKPLYFLGKKVVEYLKQKK